MQIRQLIFSLALLIVLASPAAVLAGQWAPTQNPACEVWNEFPEPGEQAEWSGKCSNGRATGYGKLQWFVNGQPSEQFTGNLRDGKKNGYGAFLYINGDVFEGMFRDNLRNGRGLLRRPDQSCEQGFWLNNQPVTAAEYSAWLEQSGAPWRVEDLRIAGLTVGDVMVHPFVIGLGLPLSDIPTRPQAGIGREVTYPGLILGFVKISKKDPLPLYILRGITVTSPAYPTERGLVVGDSAEKAVALYGQPLKQFTCPPDRYCRQTCAGDACLLYYRSQTGLEWQDSDAEREKAGLGFGIRDGKVVEIHLGISVFL